MTIERINSGRGHKYVIDGKPADGVTTLIGQGMAKPALPYWSAKAVAEYVTDNLSAVQGMTTLGRAGMVDALKKIPWGQRDAAATQGTRVHALAEALVHGEEVEVPPELDGYVTSCVQFLDDWQVRPVLVERVVAHRHWGYCGTLDLVADLADGTRRILDYKTSRSGIWPETAFQLAAYRNAEVFLDENNTEQSMPDVDIVHGLAVWLRPDGYTAYDVECGERVFKDFLHIAQVARTTKRMKDYLSTASLITEEAA